MVPEIVFSPSAFPGLFEKEELHSELAKCVSEEYGLPVLKHRLVYSVPYLPVLNKSLNLLFSQKTDALSAASQAGLWKACIELFERPYRVEAFCHYRYLMSDTEYWELLATVWIDSENIRENQLVWEELLSSNRGCKQAFVGSGEELAAMPESFLIYQGHTSERDDGWSWSVDEPTARWFAHRFAQLERSSPVVTVALVQRTDVLAYRQDRGENEIIVNPLRVKVQRTYAPQDL